MKSVRSLALVLSLSAVGAVQAADTAYAALRVVGKQHGQAVLNSVVELRGRNGSPQPAVWKIILKEPTARGGIREIEVQRGRVISERAPTVRGISGEAMDFSHLNLDSEGVFTVVNQEAQQRGIVFDRVDYSLRSGSGGGSPVWTADLFDRTRGQVASYQIAADSGAILSQSQPRTPVADVPVERDYVAARPLPPVHVEEEYIEPPVSRGDRGYSRPGEPFRGVGDFFQRLGRRFERRGEQLENFVTGKRGSR